MSAALLAREPALAGLLASLQRARATIEVETEALRANAPVDHSEFRRQKDLCLLDLSRRDIVDDVVRRDPEILAAVRELRTAIIENQSTLRMHLTAAREVSAILLRAIADAESDRTYTAQDAMRGRRR